MESKRQAADHLRRIVGICMQEWRDLDTDPRFFAIRHEAEAALHALAPDPCPDCGRDPLNQCKCDLVDSSIV